MSLTSVDLSAPAHTVTDEDAERELDVDVLEVVLAGASNRDPRLTRLAPDRRHRNRALASQVLARDFTVAPTASTERQLGPQLRLAHRDHREVPVRLPDRPQHAGRAVAIGERGVAGARASASASGPASSMHAVAAAARRRDRGSESGSVLFSTSAPRWKSRSTSVAQNRSASCSGAASSVVTTTNVVRLSCSSRSTALRARDEAVVHRLEVQEELGDVLEELAAEDAVGHLVEGPARDVDACARRACRRRGTAA